MSRCVLSLTSALRVNEKHKASLQDILYYSLFKTENELLTELKAINSTCSMGSSGTRIIIWSLRRSDTHTHLGIPLLHSPYKDIFLFPSTSTIEFCYVEFTFKCYFSFEIATLSAIRFLPWWNCRFHFSFLLEHYQNLKFHH